MFLDNMLQPFEECNFNYTTMVDCRVESSLSSGIHMKVGVMCTFDTLVFSKLLEYCTVHIIIKNSSTVHRDHKIFGSLAPKKITPIDIYTVLDSISLAGCRT